MKIRRRNLPSFIALFCEISQFNFFTKQKVNPTRALRKGDQKQGRGCNRGLEDPGNSGLRRVIYGVFITGMYRPAAKMRGGEP